MFLTWQSIYSVNVKELDEQHQKIFTLINNLFEVRQNCAPEKIALIIKELKDYGSYHLSTEEKYFEQFNYPDRELHTIQHDNYRKRVIEFESKISPYCDINNIKELVGFLKNWWLNHIQNTDQQYSTFFNSKGLI